jgi:sugar fermentation stimulation protein A
MMNLPSPLIPGQLVRRYQRFLADIQLDDQRVITAHTPNTGRMQQCAEPGTDVLVSKSDNPKRKLAFSWELARVNGHWVDINTIRANRVVEEALCHNRIPELRDFQVRREYPFGESRLDFMLAKDDQRVLLEVKSVTLCCEPEVACFPDAVTTRGQKHLAALSAAVRAGWRAVIFFLVQRAETKRFSPADRIDPDYGRLLREACASGVEAIAYRAVVTPRETKLGRQLPVVLSPRRR